MMSCTKFALVPVEPTEEMSRQLSANCDTPDCDLDWVVPVVITASPNAGEVSREQVNDLVNLLHDAAHDGLHFDEVVAQFLDTLNLSVEAMSKPAPVIAEPHTFEWALTQMKRGEKVCRAEWAPRRYGKVERVVPHKKHDFPPG